MAKQDPSTNKIPTRTKAAVPGGKNGASFVKRSGAKGKVPYGGKEPDYEYGPAVSGSGTVASGDDRAGTRSRANLPPKTEAMAAPAAELPDAVSALAADVLPMPTVNDTAKTEMTHSRTGWDHERDMKLGKAGSR